MTSASSPICTTMASRTILGHRGRFGWRDACRLCVEHPTHPTFMVAKLWGYFIAEPIPASDARKLERVYVDSGYETRPLVEAVLRHPLLYAGARMVLPPVVFCAGMLRALGQTVQTDAWGWIGQLTGQKLFEPPNVAGWDYADWLDTARWAGRLTAVNYAVGKTVLDPAATPATPPGRTPGRRSRPRSRTGVIPHLTHRPIATCLASAPVPGPASAPRGSRSPTAYCARTRCARSSR